MLTKVIAQSSIKYVEERISEVQKIVIVAHVAPDGDAMGSSLGLAHYLKAQEKDVTIIMPSSFPTFLDWMPGALDVLIYTSDQSRVQLALQEAELLFALDFNVEKRLDTLADDVLSSPAIKILVDHHLHPGDFCDHIISYPQISSTSELVFRLICRMGDFDLINKQCAECIYTGMMTDTGAFTYNSNNPEIYFIISELLRKHIDKDEIYGRVFKNFTADRIRLQGFVLSEKMRVYNEYPATLMTLSLEEARNFNFQRGDSEGFVNIPLSIQGVVFSVFMREDEEKIKISLRSSGTFPCNKFAAECFNGGGHLNASGGEFYGSMEDAIAIFEKTLPRYFQE